MTDYLYRLVIVIPIANQSQANQVAASWDPAGGGAQTFGAVRLSSTGQEPATHLACSTLCKQDFHDAAPGLSSLVTFVYDVAGGLRLPGGASSWETYSCAGWSGNQCFADAGLQVIQAVLPPG